MISEGATAAAQRYEFGDFVLERSQMRVLQRDGVELALPPRLFNALLLFVQRPGELLDKELLMSSLWPGLVVEENNLNQVISGLRRALGDDTQSTQFIQTVPRRGYRFVAPVRAAPETQAGPAPVPDPGPGSVPGTLVAGGRRHWLRTAGGSVAVAAIAGVGWWQWRTGVPSAAPRTAGATLAVLPFKPLAADGRNDLLEVGMADSLAVRLSTAPGLVVRSTGSVLRYAGRGQDPLRAARELDVAWIVDGTVQQRDGRLYVSARLLRAEDGSVAWSGSFDERLSNLFDVQDQISARITQALPSILQASSAAIPHLGSLGGTRSTEAYELYVAAAWRSQDMRGESADMAIELLNRALAIDPSYALAWVMLAWAYRRRLWRNDAWPGEVSVLAQAALDRALTLVPNLPQAHAGRGHNLLFLDMDWAGAERECRAVLDVNPNESSARFALALVLFITGRIDEGFLHMRLARELDPMSPVFNTVEASLLLDHGQLDAAQARLDRVLVIAPQHGLAHLTLGLLQQARGRTAEAETTLRRAAAMHDGSTRPKAILGAHLAAQGQRDEAHALLAELVETGRRRYVQPTSVAMVHAALGETEPALAALEQALAARDYRVAYLKDDRAFASLRGEARFLRLLKQLGLDAFGKGLAPV